MSQVFMCFVLRLPVYFYFFYSFLNPLSKVAGHFIVLFSTVCVVLSNQRNESVDFLCDCVCLSPGITLWSVVVVYVRPLNLQQSLWRSFSNCTQNTLTSIHSVMSEHRSYVNVHVSVWQALPRPAPQMQLWLWH